MRLRSSPKANPGGAREAGQGQAATGVLLKVEAARLRTAALKRQLSRFFEDETPAKTAKFEAGLPTAEASQTSPPATPAPAPGPTPRYATSRLTGYASFRTRSDAEYATSRSSCRAEHASSHARSHSEYATARSSFRTDNARSRKR